MKSYRLRRRTRRRIKNWILFSVVFVAVLSVVLYFAFRPKPTGRLDDQLQRTEISAANEIEPFADGCAYVDKQTGELYYIDKNNSLAWGFSGMTQDMQLVSSKNRLGVFVASKLQMISDEGKLLYSKVYDYPIQGIAVSDNISMLLQSKGAYDCISIVNAQGDIIDTIDQQENQTFLSFGVFSTDNCSVWIILADTSGISPSYKFITYRYADTKHITVSYTDYNQIIYAPVFLQNKINLLGSHEVIGIDYTGKVISRTRCVGYEQKANNYNTEKAMLLSPVQTLTDANKRYLCVFESGVTFFLEEQEEVLGSVVTGDYLYLFTTHNLFAYNRSSLYKVTYPLPQEIHSFEADDNIVYLIGSDIYRLQLR